MTVAPNQPQKSFAALRHPGFRIYFAGNMLAMMADSIEHVISYWIAYQKFRSPALGGFAVLSHWIPYLLFSVYAGVLADRYDPRRLVQTGMGLFMVASLGWALLFLTDSLEMWHAVVLLTIHGLAGVFWGPPGQLLLHDIIADPKALPSAVRLMATSRSLGLIGGPAIGGLFLMLFGPSLGLLLNAMIYLPLTLWLWKAPYGPKFRAIPIPTRALRGLSDIFVAAREVASNRTVWSMIVLAGSASFMIASAYQAQMPEFAADLGHGDPDVSYSVLLAADALGALLGGILLESRGLLPPNPRTACILAMLWCCAIGAFAVTSWYPAAVALMFVAGIFDLAFSSMAQALVQLGAPADIRGRVLGLYSTAVFGLRAFSGVTIGLGGAVFGIHVSLFVSAAILLALVAALMFVIRAPQRGP